MINNAKYFEEFFRKNTEPYWQPVIYDVFSYVSSGASKKEKPGYVRTLSPEHDALVGSLPPFFFSSYRRPVLILHRSHWLGESHNVCRWIRAQSFRFCPAWRGLRFNKQEGLRSPSCGRAISNNKLQSLLWKWNRDNLGLPRRMTEPSRLQRIRVHKQSNCVSIGFPQHDDNKFAFLTWQHAF